MTKTAKAAVATRSFPIVLKSIINDAMNEKTIADDNAKRIRAKIRANEKAQAVTNHVRNTSHVAHNQAQYDAIRCSFDDLYAQQLIDAKAAAADARKAARKSKGDDAPAAKVSLAKADA